MGPGSVIGPMKSLRSGVIDMLAPESQMTGKAADADIALRKRWGA